MEKKNLKHLIVAIGGIGLIMAGPTIYNWFIVASKDTIVGEPFQIIGVLLVIAGVLCCVGAMLCQLDRYDKK